VVPLITGKPVEAQVNDDNFIVPWFSAKAQQNQVRKRRSGKRGDVLFASYIFEHSFAFLAGVGRFNGGVGWWRWI
jgi:hypothetical protein